MPHTQNRAVMIWLFGFAFIVAFLLVFGGFTRLTRSGLSIVEWNPVSGAMPPTTAQAWQVEFAKYQATPEFQKVNSSMTLDQYKEIFIVEWIHREIARTAGLVYAFPVFYFLFRKTIPFKEFGIYFAMGLLFIAQAVMGWIMVSSGLVNRPSVGHLDLTAHLLLALTLFGLSLWTAFGHGFGFPVSAKKVKWSTPAKVGLGALILLILQISYGGMTAGLKAGHVSDTWPLMFGQLVPLGLFKSAINLFEAPQTIVFLHRWLAFLGLIAVPLVYWAVKKANYPAEIRRGLQWLIGLVAVQITFGVIVILSRVQIAIALTHQAIALTLFAAGIFFLHRLRAFDYQRQ